MGSNIANVLFVLGATALAAPLVVHTRLFRLDVPVMILVALALWGLGADGGLSALDGAGLSVALVGYFAWTLIAGRREQRRLEGELKELTDAAPPSGVGLLLAIAQVIGGLALLVVGADYLVEGCKTLAIRLGVSQMVIGLSVTAIGTSLPELVTSLMAARRGKRDLAVGNVVGSNILNILAVLGLSAVAAPSGIPVSNEALAFHIPVMAAVSVCCLPIFLTGAVIARWEGAAMLLFYVMYLAFSAFCPPADSAAGYSASTTLLFVAPLGALTAASMLAPAAGRP